MINTHQQQAMVLQEISFESAFEGRAGLENIGQTLIGDKAGKTMHGFWRKYFFFLCEPFRSRILKSFGGHKPI